MARIGPDELRPFGAYHKGERIGTVRARDHVDALGEARRRWPDRPDVVCSPDAEGGGGGEEQAPDAPAGGGPA